MRLVNRYILSHFKRFFLLSLMAFVVLYLVVDFLDKIETFARNNAPAKLYLLYYLNTTPMVIVQIIPLAVLLAVFLTIGALSRTNELTAMRSGGISLGHVASPLLGIALVISLGVLATSELVVPHTSENARRIYNVDVKGKQILAAAKGNLWFYNSGQLIHIRFYDANSQILSGVIALKTDDRQQPLRRIDAPLGYYVNNAWVLKEAVVRTFDPNTGEPTSLERLAQLPLEMDKTPEDFRLSQPHPEEMNILQLQEMITTLREEGFDSTRFRVDLYAKIATPFACLVMAFFGIPFAVQRGRNSNLAIGIGLSIAIGFLFFIAQTVLQAFGYSQVLPPLVAAWGANVIFLLLGLWSLLSTRS